MLQHVEKRVKTCLYGWVPGGWAALTFEGLRNQNPGCTTAQLRIKVHKCRTLSVVLMAYNPLLHNFNDFPEWLTRQSEKRPAIGSELCTPAQKRVRPPSSSPDSLVKTPLSFYPGNWNDVPRQVYLCNRKGESITNCSPDLVNPNVSPRSNVLAEMGIGSPPALRRPARMSTRMTPPSPIPGSSTESTLCEEITSLIGSSVELKPNQALSMLSQRMYTFGNYI